MDRIVEKCKFHLTVTVIIQAFLDLSFSFKPFVREDILNESKNLSSARAPQEHNILKNL